MILLHNSDVTFPMDSFILNKLCELWLSGLISAGRNGGYWPSPVWAKLVHRLRSLRTCYGINYGRASGWGQLVRANHLGEADDYSKDEAVSKDGPNQ